LLFLVLFFLLYFASCCVFRAWHRRRIWITFFCNSNSLFCSMDFYCKIAFSFLIFVGAVDPPPTPSSIKNSPNCHLPDFLRCVHDFWPAVNYKGWGSKWFMLFSNMQILQYDTYLIIAMPADVLTTTSTSLPLSLSLPLPHATVRVQPPSNYVIYENPLRELPKIGISTIAERENRRKHVKKMPNKNKLKVS